MLKHMLFLGMVIVTSSCATTFEQKNIKIAMLHLELKYADLEHNAQLIEDGIELAAKHGADWVMTPELALTGYRFDLKIGTDWIEDGPDQYVERIQHLADQHGIIIFLSHLERVNSSSNNINNTRLFNTLFVIDRSGKIIARHQKINTIPIAESWSTPGNEPTLITVDQQKVGLLICADAWPETHAKYLKEQGAELILSSASWAPGEYGPGDTWEKRSRETELPIFVNNRTGLEREFDLRNSVSVVSHSGERLMSHQSSNSQVVLVNWDVQDNTLLGHSTRAIISQPN